MEINAPGDCVQRRSCPLLRSSFPLGHGVVSLYGVVTVRVSRGLCAGLQDLPDARG